MVASDDGVGRRLLRRVGALSRYDLILTVIPVAFLAASLASHLSTVTARTAFATAALVGGLALLDATFLNPPRSGSGPA